MFKHHELISAKELDISRAVLGAQLSELAESSSEDFLLGHNNIHVAESSAENEIIGHGEIHFVDLLGTKSPQHSLSFQGSG